MKKIQKIALWITITLFGGVAANAVIQGAAHLWYWTFYELQVQQTVREMVKPEALK